ncbi:MAG: ribosomal subunit interface protein [Planctomycetes bacterium RBG_16_64_10]|nr:MAG: ribosomal subunit interface protein [Planctomycetes bacterium RBG_16_64_10]
MQVTIATRHGQLSETTQAKITEKVQRLSRIFERLTAIDVTVDLEDRETPHVDIKVSAEHKHDFVATQGSANLMASVDGALHKLEQQLRKYKERIQRQHRDSELRRQGAAPRGESDGP